MIKCKIWWDQQHDAMQLTLIAYDGPDIKTRYMDSDRVWHEVERGAIIPPTWTIDGPLWDAVAGAFREFDSRNSNVGLLEDAVADARKVRDQALAAFFGETPIGARQ